MRLCLLDEGCAVFHCREGCAIKGHGATFTITILFLSARHRSLAIPIQQQFLTFSKYFFNISENCSKSEN